MGEESGGLRICELRTYTYVCMYIRIVYMYIHTQVCTYTYIQQTYGQLLRRCACHADVATYVCTSTCVWQLEI